MTFFSGDMEGQNGHEALAKKIAMEGKEYTAKHWRYEDMEACQSQRSRLPVCVFNVLILPFHNIPADFYRLVLEWARCTSKSLFRSLIFKRGT